MPTARVSQRAEAPDVEDGTYNLRIARIEENPDNQFQGKPRPQLKWVFEFPGEDGEPVEINSWTSLSYFEGGNGKQASRLYEWAIKLDWQPTEDEDGLVFDLDKPVGVVVQALVENKNGWPKVTKILKRVEG